MIIKKVIDKISGKSRKFFPVVNEKGIAEKSCKFFPLTEREEQFLKMSLITNRNFNYRYIKF